MWVLRKKKYILWFTGILQTLYFSNQKLHYLFPLQIRLNLYRFQSLVERYKMIIFMLFISMSSIIFWRAYFCRMLSDWNRPQMTWFYTFFFWICVVLHSTPKTPPLTTSIWKALVWYWLLFKLYFTTSRFGFPPLRTSWVQVNNTRKYYDNCPNQSAHFDKYSRLLREHPITKCLHVLPFKISLMTLTFFGDKSIS